MDYLQQLIERYPGLITLRSGINEAFNIITASFNQGGKLLIAGNGGSAADAEHITGELMKNFILKRKLPESFTDMLKGYDPDLTKYLAANLQPGLPAISLSGHYSLSTACINDIDANIIFAQQIYGYGKKEDVFLAISTSGNSKNILYATVTAKAKKMKVIALSGFDGGKLKSLADVSIIIPEHETYKIQELHLPVYHQICLMLEDHFF